jgi:ribonuclease E
MIVIDFIDMVLESNRDLVLRRLTECLGRDRTKHQVAEVTSLGLVQMTRKRVGQGLLEVFSEPCEHCRGRGVIVHTEPVDDKRRGGGNGTNGNAGAGGSGRRDRSSGRDGAAGKDAKEQPVEAAPEVETAPDTPAVDEGSGRSGGRRSRGRRNRGQSGEERAAEDAAVLTEARPDGDEPTDDARSAVEAALDAQPTVATDQEPAAFDDLPQVAEPAAEAEPVTADEPEAESAPEAVPVPETDGPPAAVTARPRRRRAASRPAGPPV